MGLETGLRPPSRVGAATFGRYEAIAKIGEGGMGQVFLARARGEAGFQRLFALKVIGVRGEAAPLMRTLLNEAKMAARVQHRNVVGILDVGSYDDGHYLVMEYVEGCTLSELQRRRRDARPPRLILPIMIDALFGLHAAHAVTDEAGAPLHLIHSDITPQNLLIGLDGSCRVTDFGIARVRDLALAKGTRPDRVKGTPGYMSPEQVVGDPLDLRSDIFSAGVVLWNALTGKKLFHGPTDHASMFHVLKRNIPKPSAVGLAPPPVFDGLVLKALERDPARRFQTAEEMATALRDAAMRAGQLGSPSAVAEWVTTTFAADLETRRRTIREVTEHHKVSRIDGDRPSLAAISTTLPRFETLNTGDVGEHLSLEDLSLESDEMDVGEQLLSSDEAAGRVTPAPGLPPAERRSRALPIALGFGGAALILVLVLWWLKNRVVEPDVAGHPAVAPTAAAAAPAPAPAVAPATKPEPPPPAPTPVAAETPPPPAPKPAAEPPPPEPPAPAPAKTAPPEPETAVTVDPDEKAPSRHGASRPRVRAAKPAAVAPAVAAPPPTKPAAEPKPETPPPAAPDKNRPDLESNPYLYK